MLVTEVSALQHGSCDCSKSTSHVRLLTNSLRTGKKCKQELTIRTYRILSSFHQVFAIWKFAQPLFGLLRVMLQTEQRYQDAFCINTQWRFASLSFFFPPSVCTHSAGVIPTGDEDEAKGPVEKAHGEVPGRGRARLWRSSQVRWRGEKNSW